MKQPAIQKPEGLKEVLLHACCAPCSSAIVEWMMANGVRPVIYYFNPNLDPEGRFQNEMAKEPERGRRCERCFTFRLIAAAKKAQELNIPYFTTTLASSRWKSLEQINQAGLIAEQTISQHPSPNLVSPKYWAQNWRKGGLYERRNQLLKEYNFYNQQYCGCEFSMRGKSTEIKEK